MLYALKKIYLLLRVCIFLILNFNYNQYIYIHTQVNEGHNIYTYSFIRPKK